MRHEEGRRTLLLEANIELAMLARGDGGAAHDLVRDVLRERAQCGEDGEWILAGSCLPDCANSWRREAEDLPPPLESAHWYIAMMARTVRVLAANLLRALGWSEDPVSDRLDRLQESVQGGLGESPPEDQGAELQPVEVEPWGRMLAADATLANWLDTCVPGESSSLAHDYARDVRSGAARRWRAYESRMVTAEELCAHWKGFQHLLGRLAWQGKVKSRVGSEFELQRPPRPPPGLPLAVLEGVLDAMAHGPGGEPEVRTLPAHRLLLWAAYEAHRRAPLATSDEVVRDVSGGWRVLEKLLRTDTGHGASGSGREALRKAALAFEGLRLWAVEVTQRPGPKTPANVRFRFSTTLLNTSSDIVPLPPELPPGLHKQSRGASVALYLEVLCELRRRCAELALNGGVRLGYAWWKTQAERHGVREDAIERLQSLWTGETGKAAPILHRRGSLYRLAVHPVADSLQSDVTGSAWAPESLDGPHTADEEEARVVPFARRRAAEEAPLYLEAEGWRQRLRLPDRLGG